MPMRGVKCIRGHISLDEHERCMVQESGPPCLVPPTILQIIIPQKNEREEAGIVFSPSTLSACHRQSALSVDHDYWIDIRQAYKMARGTIFHRGLSQEPPPAGTLGVVRELLMSATIDTKYGEKVLHGTADEVVLLGMEEYVLVDGHDPVKHRLHVKITDFKTRTEVGHDLVSADRRHVVQINEYAWLVRRFLPGWLKKMQTAFPELVQHLFMDVAGNDFIVLPDIDEVIVDELSITYLDMSRPRTFTSKGFLYDQGKMLGDRIGGHWVRRKPPEHEELELEPVHQMQDGYVEGIIRKGIERQIEARTLLAPPLAEEEDVRLMCRSCPVRPACIDTGKREGYNMALQEAIG